MPAMPDLELDLELDPEPDLEPDLKLDLGSDIGHPNLKLAESAALEPPAKKTDEVPTIEIQLVDEAETEVVQARVGEKRDRVISANQLADIRARMQQKMRAAKSKTG